MTIMMMMMMIMMMKMIKMIILEMMIEVVGHPLAQTDGNLYLILAL